MTEVKFIKAEIDDLGKIIELLIEDDLGKNRESLSGDFEAYKKAFLEIQGDKNQYLIIGKIGEEIVATCQLSILENLTFKGSKRLQIEGVRVKKSYRGRKIGKKMFEFAIDFAKEKKCKIVQLTTNSKRIEAQKFYENLGFEASHVGFKLNL